MYDSAYLCLHESVYVSIRILICAILYFHMAVYVSAGVCYLAICFCVCVYKLMHVLSITYALTLCLLLDEISMHVDCINVEWSKG